MCNLAAEASVPNSVNTANIPAKTAVNQRFLTTEELAELCRTSPATVRYWRHTGYGPKGTRVGKRVLYGWNEVEQWLVELGRGE